MLKSKIRRLEDRIANHMEGLFGVFYVVLVGLCLAMFVLMGYITYSDGKEIERLERENTQLQQQVDHHLLVIDQQAERIEDLNSFVASNTGEEYEAVWVDIDQHWSNLLNDWGVIRSQPRDKDHPDPYADLESAIDDLQEVLEAKRAVVAEVLEDDGAGLTFRQYSEEIRRNLDQAQQLTRSRRHLSTDDSKEVLARLILSTETLKRLGPPITG